jgi:uncharacterized protein YlxP (DUF503 family)
MLQITKFKKNILKMNEKKYLITINEIGYQEPISKKKLGKSTVCMIKNAQLLMKFETKEV